MKIPLDRLFTLLLLLYTAAVFCSVYSSFRIYSNVRRFYGSLWIYSSRSSTLWNAVEFAPNDCIRMKYVV